MKKLRYIKKEIIKLYGKEKANTIIELAKKYYQECLELCKDASKGEFMHLENTIIPTTAFYKALLEIDKKNAFKNTNTIIISLCEKASKVINGMLKIPSMKSVFMKIMPKMVIKRFGRECGFDYENFESNKNILQIDMIKCPYIKFAKRFKVEELITIFCESDIATYGNLLGIDFKRTETLGTGGNKCDFKFIRTYK